MSLYDKIQGGIIGVAVGDALGVPVEFKTRAYLKHNPISDLTGYGVWNQPVGTWSDDTSLTLCLLEGLCSGVDIELIGKLFVKWYQEGYWGAHNEVFDIGGSTKYSLKRILNGESPKFSGNFFEEDNGNGSLMRTLPLVYYLKDENDIESIYNIIKSVSSITHAHFRSCFSCFIYCILCIHILKGKTKKEAYYTMQKDVNEFAKAKKFNLNEVLLFKQILEDKIWLSNEEDIKSSGYVLHSLGASLWCFYNTDSYEKAVIKAVNLGGDTDTTGAITGGLSGLYYGITNIPETWKFKIVRYNDIENLISRFYKTIL